MTTSDRSRIFEHIRQQQEITTMEPKSQAQAFFNQLPPRRFGQKRTDRVTEADKQKRKVRDRIEEIHEQRRLEQEMTL